MPYLDDLEQEAKLALLDAGRDFDPCRGRAFVAYARRAIRWRLLKYVNGACPTIHLPLTMTREERASAPKVVASLDDPGFRAAEGRAGENDYGYEAVENRLAIEQLLAGLPSAEAALVREHILVGRTLREIAARRGVHMLAVRSRYYSALRRLREMVTIQATLE